MASDPTVADDWRLRAQVHADVGDWDSAAQDLRRYLALRPNEDWCSMGYWVVGPYPEDLDQHFPPEIDPDPFKPTAAVSEPEPSSKLLDWQSAPLNSTGFLNLGPLLGNAEHVSAYVLLRIYCPQKTPVAIMIGADDQSRLWLNGKQIFEQRGEHDAVVDENAVPAALASGWNTLLTRVTNATGDQVLYLRLTTNPKGLPNASGH